MSLEQAGQAFQTAVASGQVNASATGPGSAPINTQSPTQAPAQTNHQDARTNVDPVTGKANEMNQAQRAEADQKAIQQEILDLDGVEKFKYQGKEYTPEEFKKTQMFERDYRKKTAEMAKERENTANLEFDLAKVKRDPSLADQFRRLYPERYHSYLNLVLEERREEQDNAASQSKSDAQDLPPAVAKQIQELQRRLDNYEKGIGDKEHAAKVSTIQAELDQLFKGFETKYDFAVEESVLTKAEALIAKGYQMTPAAWERLWKSSHEQMKAKAQKWSDSRTQEQLKVNQEGGDMGRGGGTPSAGKRKMSLSDASDHMIASLSKG